MIIVEPILQEAFEYEWEKTKVPSLYKQLLKLGVETKTARIIRKIVRTAHIGLMYDSYKSWIWIYNTDTGNDFGINPKTHDHCFWLALIGCNELDKVDGIEIIRGLMKQSYILQRFQFTGVEAPVSPEV